MLGDAIEVTLGFFNSFRIESEQALTTRTDAAHDSRTFQDSKVLGDRLPGQSGAFGELRDRAWLPAAEHCNQR